MGHNVSERVWLCSKGLLKDLWPELEDTAQRDSVLLQASSQGWFLGMVWGHGAGGEYLEQSECLGDTCTPVHDPVPSFPCFSGYRPGLMQISG